VYHSIGVENMFSTMGQLLNGKQLTATTIIDHRLSANFDIVVKTGNSAVDIAAKPTLLLPVSNLTDLHSDYSSSYILALKKLLKSWNNET